MEHDVDVASCRVLKVSCIYKSIFRTGHNDVLLYVRLCMTYAYVAHDVCAYVCSHFDANCFLPICETSIASILDGECEPEEQSFHPTLPKYFPSRSKHGSHMTHDDLSALLASDDEVILDFLTDVGVIPAVNVCKNCGQPMRRWLEKSTGSWYWICTKSKDGVRCKNKRFSVKTGTFIGDAKLSTRNILWITWHFVHGLTEVQCKLYTNIGQKNNATIVRWYEICRTICDNWIRKNFEGLGGYGEIVEIDESYLPGAPKFGRGRSLGWEDEEQWAFGLVGRNSLDCWIERVGTRGLKTLVPTIDAHCKPGTVFTSDKWRAYYELEKHLETEDCLHYSVNHKKNFVDPETGAHTQTVEGMWRHMKDFFPKFGLRADHIDTYLGTFMWLRYVKQRKLDVFRFFLQCAAQYEHNVY